MKKEEHSTLLYMSLDSTVMLTYSCDHGSLRIMKRGDGIVMFFWMTTVEQLMMHYPGPDP